MGERHSSEAQSRSQRVALRAEDSICHKLSLQALKGIIVGSWGPGIFDNDDARDHLFEVTRELADQVDQALADATSLKLTGKATTNAELAQTLAPVLPNIEIICVLHESLGGGFLPEPESAADWHSQFERLAEHSTTERLDVIRETFERLLRLAEQCWEE